MVSWADDKPRSTGLFGRDVSQLPQLPPLPPPRERDGQLLLFGRPVTKPAPPKRKPSKAMQAKQAARRRVDVRRIGTEEDNVWRACGDCTTADDCAGPPRACKVFGY